VATYPITPVGKPRMTQRDRWKKRPATDKYWAFCDACRFYGVSIENNDAVIFHIPMPASWSKKKKTEYDGKPHQQKPDIDNLCKALLDAIYNDDAHIHAITLSKLWAYEGAIEVKKESGQSPN